MSSLCFHIGKLKYEEISDSYKYFCCCLNSHKYTR